MEIELNDALGKSTAYNIALSADKTGIVQGSAKKWSPGCMNAAGKARQKWYAKAVTKFTKPGARLLAEPFTFLSVAVSL